MSVGGLLLVLGLEVHRVAHRLDDQLLGPKVAHVHQDAIALVVHLHLGEAVASSGATHATRGEEVTVKQRVVWLHHVVRLQQREMIGLGSHVGTEVNPPTPLKPFLYTEAPHIDLLLTSY